MPTPSPDRALRHSPSLIVPSADVMKDILEQHSGGRLVPPELSEYAEEHLTTTADRGELVTAARDVIQLLEQAGFIASLQYCRSGDLKHPLPVITARSETGEYLIPNINMVWDPTIPLERGGSGGAPHKKLVIAPEDLEHADSSMPHSSLRVERFASGNPVSIMLYPSESPDAQALAVPIFSAAAFEEALSHAATRAQDATSREYSYIFDELVIPKLRDTIRSETEQLGAREIPEIIDNGTAEDGRLFDIKAYVPKANIVEMIRFQCAPTIEKGAAKLAGVFHEPA